MDHVEFHSAPVDNLTTMVVAFGGWINAGRAATGAIRHLIRHLSASHLATIDPEEFFNFTRERPNARLTSGDHRVIRWPRSEFFSWKPPNGEEGLLLFNSREPNQKWRTFSKAIFDVAEQCGVKQVVSLGAFLAGAPHTRPARCTARTTDPKWKGVLEDWGIYQRPSYEGPTGISLVVLDAAAKRGLPHLDFMGQSPHYLQGMENPVVKQALLTYLSRLLDLELGASLLDDDIVEFRTQCDRAVAQDSAIRAHVQALERDYDSTVGEASNSLSDTDLNSDQLMQDLEDFLREERDGGKDN